MAWVLFGDEASKYTLTNSIGDYYNTLGRRQLYCLFNSLFGLTTKKTSMQRVPAPLWVELTGNFHYKGPVRRKCFHGMTFSWEIATYRNTSFIVRRAGLLLSQQDFEWRWSVPLFQCLTVLEFSFNLFDLCLLITFFNFIMNYVPIVTFWVFTYHKIWILSIMFCFIWSYWIIYFLACL